MTTQDLLDFAEAITDLARDRDQLERELRDTRALLAATEKARDEARRIAEKGLAFQTVARHGPLEIEEACPPWLPLGTFCLLQALPEPST